MNISLIPLKERKINIHKNEDLSLPKVLLKCSFIIFL